jgi:hypothetical protein
VVRENHVKHNMKVAIRDISYYEIEISWLHEVIWNRRLFSDILLVEKVTKSANMDPETIEKSFFCSKSAPRTQRRVGNPTRHFASGAKVATSSGKYHSTFVPSAPKLPHSVQIDSG